MNIPPYGDTLKKLNAHMNTLKVSAQVQPNMTVRISAGSYWFNNKTFVDFYGGNSKAIVSSSQAGTKFVIVGLSKQGSIRLIDGVPNTNPVLPELEPGIMPLAAVVVRPGVTAITEDNIFDIRQVFQSPNFITTHENIEGRDAKDAHTISSITDLQDLLDEKVEKSELNSRLAAKSEVDGTTSATFTLNTDENGNPIERAAFAIKRGLEPEVALVWNETDNKWEIDQDLVITDSAKGLILTNNDGATSKEFRIVVSENGIIGTKDSAGLSAFQDQLVKASATDTVPGFLGDKVDGDNIAIENEKLTIGATLKATIDAKAKQSDINGLQTNVSNLTNTVTNLDTEVGTVQGTVTTLEADVVGLNTEVGVVQAAVGVLDTDVAELQIDVAGLETRKVDSTDAGDIEFIDETKGFIMKSPDGSRWKVTIDDTGAFVPVKL